MTTAATRTSGIFKQPLPTILKYPTVFGFTKVSSYLKDRLCYVIRHYGNDGITVLLTRQTKQDRIVALCGDWQGNNIDLMIPVGNKHRDMAIAFVNNDLPLFIRTMQLIKLTQAQFFLAFGPTGLILTDIQISLNKFAGPGMVRDIFGKIFPVPEVIKVEGLDDRAIEYIERGTGSYEGDVIIKPSKFSLFSQDKKAVPLYAEMRR
jgi:hypothetical protein